jgi:hypothetical protein
MRSSQPAFKGIAAIIAKDAVITPVTVNRVAILAACQDIIPVRAIEPSVNLEIPISTECKWGIRALNVQSAARVEGLQTAIQVTVEDSRILTQTKAELGQRA